MKVKGKTGNMSTISMKLMEYALWVLVFVVVICAGIYGTKAIYNLGYEVFDRNQRNVESRDLSITIAEGQTTGEVAKALEEAEVIDSAFVFKIQGILFDLDVKPGTYIVNTKASSLELFEKLNEGPTN